ncbi:prostaglandin E synthase [Anguilla anguilla]|uniref:prostaglandin E synthase n=1 Tax=Anguilla anguilla TaxID=7936 RepID=UPI0015A7F506|nr:prostaglandin E synthase [Anguilla anguilla]
MVDNEVFASFVFYSTLLILKMYILAIITGQQRLHRKAFCNPEDAMRHGGLQYHREDPDVERSRRAHRNDMENIFPFLFLGAVYSITEPTLLIARVHFQVFFLARIMHTVAYLFALKAPTRSVSYTIGQVSCLSMLVQILLTVGSHW